ncbi:uncharacterized protein LAESUDRAFT_726769 [Laetiporus sulphureus 93-53]|uniref:Bromo domain-containing protein n=1 Tax=Laetiporus sulphureus 93-53 TaxID=1314785 RepID=A0A165DRY0_9APHY|nr:uncharacterized protein LAESUDRAFT_726769 [Laetiporus sulphureus 93-53]KZT05506.1 hypothetical protein LAESUDRAFT_726769 [Laetiporus sulphureus 93-53]
MASTGRARRADVDASSLNNVERLIFAQAVYEYGSDKWGDVSGLLSKHPMISRPKNYFTPQTCPVLYSQLMEEAGLECSDANAAPRSKVHLKLAQHHYQRRVLELRELIAAEEAKFKTLVAEIDQIRDGLWDDKIRAQLGINAPARDVKEEDAAPQSEPAPETPELQRPQSALQSRKGTPEPIVIKDGVVETPPSPPKDEITAHPPTREPTPPHMEQDFEKEHVTPVPEETAEQNEVIEASVEAEQAEAVPAVAKTLPNMEAEEARKSPPSEEQPAEGAQEEVPTATVEPEVTVEQFESLPPSPEIRGTYPPLPAEVTVREETAAMEPAADADVTMLESQPVRESPPAPQEEHRGADGKRKAEEVEDAKTQRESKRAREESPMEEEEIALAALPKIRRQGRPPAPDTPGVSKRFQNMINMLHSQISAHRYGNLFHNPIRKAEAPDYHDIVKRPMDLKTIKARIKDGLISNSLEFQRDVYLMFANAMMYNRPGSDVYNMAEEMMLESEGHINTFRQTEGFHRI